jgi:isoleucyl-tRNA synthetase
MCGLDSKPHHRHCGAVLVVTPHNIGCNIEVSAAMLHLRWSGSARCLSSGKRYRMRVPLDETLNIPKTSFPMRANAVVREPLVQDQIGEKLYHWQYQNFKDRPLWVLHDGPPYANGSLHVGHALNKIVKGKIPIFYFF